MKKIFIYFIFYLISTQNIFSMSCRLLCQMGDYSACQSMIARISCGNEAKVSTPTTNKLSKKYQRECDANNGESCLQLGILLEKGKQVQKNVMRAEELYKKACNLDNANACAVLGTFYAEGIGNNGVNLDFDAAFKYTEKACKKDHYPACVNLGMMYVQGQGVEKKISKAVNIFKETCNKGLRVACENYEYLKNKKTYLSKQPVAPHTKSVNSSNNVKHSTNRHTSNIRVIDSVNTMTGTFKLIEDKNNFVKYVQFNKKTLMKLQDSFIGIEKSFKLRSHTIIIVWSNYSPSGLPSYRIFDIDKNGKVTYTREFSTGDYTFKAYKKGSDSIEIDLGFEDGKRKFVIYSNGKLHNKKKKSTPKGIDAKDCNWLYSAIYKEYILKARLPCTENIGYALGMGVSRAYHALIQNPNFNKSFFRTMLTEDCSRGIPLSYQDFSRAICQGNSNYPGKSHTSSQSTCSKYHVVTVQQLNIRNSPKKSSKVIGRLNRAEEVCIYEFSGKWGRTDRGWISGKYLERSQSGTSTSTSNKISKINPYMITSTPLPTRIDKVYAKLGKAYTVQLPDPDEEGPMGQIHKWKYGGGILSVAGDSYSPYKIDNKAEVRFAFLKGPRYNKVTTLYGIVINEDNVKTVKKKILTYINYIGTKNYILESSKYQSGFYKEDYDYLIRFKDPNTKLYNLFYFERGLLKKVIQGTFDVSTAG